MASDELRRCGRSRTCSIIPQFSPNIWAHYPMVGFATMAYHHRLTSHHPRRVLADPAGDPARLPAACAFGDTVLLCHSSQETRCWRKTDSNPSVPLGREVLERSNISTRWVLRQGGLRVRIRPSSTGVPSLQVDFVAAGGKGHFRKASALELSYDRRPWLDGYMQQAAHNFRCSRGRNGIRKARRSTSTA